MTQSEMNAAAVPADTGNMHEGQWVFARAGQSITLGRRPAEGGYVLDVSGPDMPRSYFFADLAALIKFQSDMEKFLVTTGWAFETFSPERRRGRDRRTWPRVENDRRRWWTDGRTRSRSRKDVADSRSEVRTARRSRLHLDS